MEEKKILKDEVLQKLGKRIKQIRIAKGYSSYEYFAYEHNISRAQYGRYEKGRIFVSALLQKLSMPLE